MSDVDKQRKERRTAALNERRTLKRQKATVSNLMSRQTLIDKLKSMGLDAEPIKFSRRKMRIAIAEKRTVPTRRPLILKHNWIECAMDKDTLELIRLAYPILYEELKDRARHYSPKKDKGIINPAAGKGIDPIPDVTKA